MPSTVTPYNRLTSRSDKHQPEESSISYLVLLLLNKRQHEESSISYLVVFGVSTHIRKSADASAVLSFACMKLEHSQASQGVV